MAKNDIWYFFRFEKELVENVHIRRILNAGKDGYARFALLMWLYAQSIETSGRLMPFDEAYKIEDIALDTNLDETFVEEAMTIFVKQNLITVLNNGAIYCTFLVNYMGEKGESAKKANMKKMRDRIEREEQAIEMNLTLEQFDELEQSNALNTTDVPAENEAETSEKANTQENCIRDIDRDIARARAIAIDISINKDIQKIYQDILLRNSSSTLFPAGKEGDDIKDKTAQAQAVLQLIINVVGDKYIPDSRSIDNVDNVHVVLTKLDDYTMEDLAKVVLVKSEAFLNQDGNMAYLKRHMQAGTLFGRGFMQYAREAGINKKTAITAIDVADGINVSSIPQRANKGQNKGNKDVSSHKAPANNVRRLPVMSFEEVTGMTPEEAGWG